MINEGWWYAVAKDYGTGAREVLGGGADINAPPTMRIVGPVYCRNDDERDALSTQLLDMPVETRVSFVGPFANEGLARLATRRDGTGPWWFVRIEGTSMLAPFLSPLGAEDPNGERWVGPGYIYGDEAEAHDFGSEASAQRWLDAHPDHAGRVERFPPERS